MNKVIRAIAIIIYLAIIVFFICYFTGCLPQSLQAPDTIGIVGSVASIVGLLQFFVKVDVTDINVDALKNLSIAVEEIHKKDRELKDKTNTIRDLEIKKDNLEILIQKASLSLFYKHESERYTERLQDYLQNHKEIQDIIQQLLNYRKLSIELGNEIEQDESIKETIELLNKFEKNKSRGVSFSFDGLIPTFSIKL